MSIKYSQKAWHGESLSSTRGMGVSTQPNLCYSSPTGNKFHEGEEVEVKMGGKRVGKVSGKLNNDFNFLSIINYCPVSSLITDIKLKRVDLD